MSGSAGVILGYRSGCIEYMRDFSEYRIFYREYSRCNFREYMSD